MVFGIMPGPKEFDSNQLQFFMKNYVGNLISLYENGIMVKTPNYPNGCQVRMILVASVGSEAIARKRDFALGATSEFPPQYGEEHTKQAQEYLDLNEKECEASFKLHSAHYFELSRLKYFDPVRMSVIDPMHSFLCSIICCHCFFLICLFDQFEMPNWVGHLPEQVGSPARAKKGDDKPSTKPIPQMHPSAPDNFLKLAAALKIILGHSFRDANIPCAKELLCDYLMEYLKLYPDDVKPTHHWVTHIFDQLQDYGPVYNFWTFLFECLNKVLKSYSMNNYSNGEIEVTFMCAFQKDVALRDMLANLNAASDVQESSTEDELLSEAVRIILATDGDTCGMVASLAHEIGQATEDYADLMGIYYLVHVSHLVPLLSQLSLGSSKTN
ncbi:hypothetical protein BDR06DRAFT_978149 [Suillus hirtellus]|nr:hypothetical protein BDR06DRAFT_978149 [Suillus hirtellus]